MSFKTVLWNSEAKLLMGNSLQEYVAVRPYFSLSVPCSPHVFVSAAVFKLFSTPPPLPTPWLVFTRCCQVGGLTGFTPNKNIFRRVKLAPSKKYFFLETCVHPDSTVSCEEPVRIALNMVLDDNPRVALTLDVWTS